MRLRGVGAVSLAAGIFVTMVVAVACGSNAPGPYTVTLSGAYSGTLAITARADYSPITATLEVIIETVAYDSSFPTYFVVWDFPPGSMVLEAGSYASSISNTFTSSYLCESKYACWQAGAFQGSLALFIASVGPATAETTAAGDPYTAWHSPHGSLTATMEPYLNETNGTVSVDVTF